MPFITSRRVFNQLLQWVQADRRSTAKFSA